VAEVVVDVGGVRAAFVAREDEVAEVIRHRYAGFLGAGPADWRFDVGRRPEGVVPLADVVVRDDGADRLRVERHDFLATLDLQARTGTVALGAVDHIAVDTFLRVAASLALLPAGGLLVHAASLARAGRAWVFAGPSGSGKTTLARLSADATLLSDEISIVRLTADGARCHGSPFWGELARAGERTTAPLVALHFLRHADRHAARPLAPRAALAALLPNVLFFATAPALVARVLDVAGALVERVPAFALGFRPDAAVWETIEHAA
jgi:hypothetical protein